MTNDNDDAAQLVSLTRYAFCYALADSVSSRIPLSFLLAFPAWA